MMTMAVGAGKRSSRILRPSFSIPIMCAEESTSGENWDGFGPLTYSRAWSVNDLGSAARSRASSDLVFSSRAARCLANAEALLSLVFNAERGFRESGKQTLEERVQPDGKDPLL
jgi:hypothetical protein